MTIEKTPRQKKLEALRGHITLSEHPESEASKELVQKAVIFAETWLDEPLDPNVSAEWRNLARACVRMHRRLLEAGITDV